MVLPSPSVTASVVRDIDSVLSPVPSKAFVIQTANQEPGNCVTVNRVSAGLLKNGRK